MRIPLYAFLKRRLPRSWRQRIKKAAGLDIRPEKMRTVERACGNSGKLALAIRTGGGLGDFIVYLALVDQLLARCDGEIHVFTLSHANAVSILGGRERVFVHYPLGFAAEKFDLVLELDHYVHVAEYDAARLESVCPELYADVLKILRWNKENIPVAEETIVQRNVIMFRAKYRNLNRWTQLSCGGVFNMDAMRANIAADENRAGFLEANGLRSGEYITVSCGADPDMGGMRQTKVWPFARYEEFLLLFRSEYPDVKTVQLATKNEPRLASADVFIKDADLEDVKIVLKHSRAHLSHEGGMVHLATQLRTPCVVLFGPTPAYYYGYPQNVNIVSPVCSGCMESSTDWSTRCVRKFSVSACMEAISKKMLAEQMRTVLGSQKTPA